MPQPSILVIVSHYNAWPTDHLVALLDQMTLIPAGLPFQTRVVVNQARDLPLKLPERHTGVEILYRPNTGYNIGAWDLGWRESPARDCYLFLQEECQILRPNWLKAFVDLAMRPNVGLVGESLHWAGLSWNRLDRYYANFPFAAKVDGREVPIPVGVRAGLARLGVLPGKTGAHLQSLVFCLRREVLEAMDGFGIGSDYAEATVAEVAASKRVEAMGLRVCEVGSGSFAYVLHPQWAGKRGSWKRKLMRWVEPWVPISLATRLRKGK